MRTCQRMSLLSLAMVAVIICAAVIVPASACAQEKARVITKDLATGIIVMSSWMDADKAQTIATTIMADTFFSEAAISCWTEQKKHWFNPRPSRRRPFVITHYIEGARNPQHSAKPHR